MGNTENTVPASSELVDWRQPAERLKLKERAFWNTVHAQGVPHYRINSRRILFSMAEIEEWLRSRHVGAAG